MLTALVFAGAGALLAGRARVLPGSRVRHPRNLARDIATGDGVPLLWPLTPAAVRIPFWIEAAAIAALAMRAWQRGAEVPPAARDADEQHHDRDAESTDRGASRGRHWRDVHQRPGR